MTIAPRRFPTFIVIGAARSGTTSVYEYLRQHPEIYVSRVKEPNFFAVEGERLDYRGPGEDRMSWITDLDGYLKLFRAPASATAVGEASTLYLYSPKAAERIHHYIPEAKLVAVLRNPVERAYSAFCFLRERGSEPLEIFTDALDAEDERVAAGWSHIWHYRRMGFYGEQLREYFDRFRADQIRVVLYDDFKDDPARVMQEIYEHVGVDASFIPDTNIRHNVSGVPRSRMVASLLGPSRLRKTLRPVIVRTLNPLVLRAKQRLLAKPELPVESAERLRAAYREDVERLRQLLGRDVTSWLAPDGQAPSAA